MGLPVKVSTIPEALEAHVRSGQTLVFGGFGRGGVAFSCIDYLADNPQKFSSLTLVKNDGNEPGLGIGQLFRNPGQVRKLIATHVGLNPEFIVKMNAREIECELVPQGIFAERLRAAGSGIPAFLHDIGMETPVMANKPRVTMDGREWLLERALPGDVAFICADRVDQAGNCWWRGSNRNMCIVAATSSRVVIAEAKEIVPMGALEPEAIHLPSVVVTAVVPARPRRHQS